VDHLHRVGRVLLILAVFLFFAAVALALAGGPA
jgi:hypothetical protein